MATSVQPKDKTVNVKGINLHYLDWGTEGKPKVLLRHKENGGKKEWFLFVESLVHYHTTLKMTLDNNEFCFLGQKYE